MGGGYKWSARELFRAPCRKCSFFAQNTCSPNRRLIGLAAAFCRCLLSHSVDSSDLEHQASTYHNFRMAASRKRVQSLNHAALPARRNEILPGSIKYHILRFSFKKGLYAVVLS